MNIEFKPDDLSTFKEKKINNKLDSTVYLLKFDGIYFNHINRNESFYKPNASKTNITLAVEGWSLGNDKLFRDDSGEDGEVTYLIKTNSNGNIISAHPIQQTISPAGESFYRGQIRHFKLLPENPLSPSEATVGTLTINIMKL